MTDQTKEELERIDEEIAKGPRFTGRVLEWLNFSSTVLDHIQHYAIPSYGDMPNDQLANWTAADCVRQIGKYIERFENNPRGQAEGLRDLLKVAHYAGAAFFKFHRELATASSIKSEFIPISSEQEEATVALKEKIDAAQEEIKEVAGLPKPPTPITVVFEDPPPPTVEPHNEDEELGPELEEQIIAHEGEVLTVYPDSKKIKTIGIGRNLEGNPLTKYEEQVVRATNEELITGKKSLTHEAAMFLMRNDLRNIKTSLTGYPWFDNLTVNRKRALIDMCMMGTKSFIRDFGPTQAHMLAGEWVNVARHMLASKWAADVMKRRAMVDSLMMAYDLPYIEAYTRYKHNLCGDLVYPH